jgi:hypothetical protein
MTASLMSWLIVAVPRELDFSGLDRVRNVWRAGA